MLRSIKGCYSLLSTDSDLIRILFILLYKQLLSSALTLSERRGSCLLESPPSHSNCYNWLDSQSATEADCSAAITKLLLVTAHRTVEDLTKDRFWERQSVLLLQKRVDV